MDCEHLHFHLYGTPNFTISVCEDCGLRDARSGSDELNFGEGAWSQSQAGDEILAEYLTPEDRTEGFTFWLIRKDQFEALPESIRALLDENQAVTAFN